MRSRRFACLLLGMWMGAGVLMQWIAAENFRSVDRLLDQPNPAATLRFKVLGPVATRQLLEYQAAEQKRYDFEAWGTAELIMGFFFFCFLLFGTREDKFSLLMALLLLIGVVVQRFVLTPQINALGRVSDFAPPEVYIPGRRALPVVQSAYNIAELAKLGVAFLLTVWLLWGTGQRRSRAEVREDLNLVNKANYRHVDR